MDVYKTLVNKKNKLTEILTDCRPDSNYSKATEKEKFDFYLKQGFINGNTYLPSLKINSSKENFGLYINKYKRYYDRYFSDEIGIKDSLSFEIQKSYENGKGNEFKNGKFYSVGSSSRFAVSCFSENLNGKFFYWIALKSKEKRKIVKFHLKKNWIYFLQIII